MAARNLGSTDGSFDAFDEKLAAADAAGAETDTSAPVVRSASPAAASGAPHVTEPTRYDAILLAGFGGPEGQDDVIPFLRNVTRGRGIPDERLEEVAHHYRHYGGVSPINQQNRELRVALQAEIDRRGLDLPVLWGNRNWDPYLEDAVTEADERGFTQLLAIATSAYSSYSGCRQYREDFARVLDSTNLEGTVRIDKVRQFFDHPGFITPFIEGVKDGLAQLERDVDGIDLASEVEVLFTTHSIPTGDADRSGPRDRDFGDGGAYGAQHRAVAGVIMESVRVERGEEGTPPWQLVFQSRSGPPTQPWLDPDINDAMELLPSAGRRAVVIVPIGFVSDHMEVLWDLDNEATDTAKRLGLASVRVSTPGTHDAYVSGLVDLIVERIEGTPAADRPSETDLGPWFDVCRPGCCENARLGFRPAVSGVLP